MSGSLRNSEAMLAPGAESGSAMVVGGPMEGNAGLHALGPGPWAALPAHTVLV